MSDATNNETPADDETQPPGLRDKLQDAGNLMIDIVLCELRKLHTASTSDKAKATAIVPPEKLKGLTEAALKIAGHTGGGGGPLSWADVLQDPANHEPESDGSDDDEGEAE